MSKRSSVLYEGRTRSLDLNRRQMMIISSTGLFGLSIPSLASANQITFSSIYLKSKKQDENAITSYDHNVSLLKRAHQNLAIYDFTHPVCSTLATRVNSKVNIGPVRYRALGLLTEDQWSEKLRLRDEAFSSIYNSPLRTIHKLSIEGPKTTYQAAKYIGSEIGELIYEQQLSDDVEKFINDILNSNSDIDPDFERIETPEITNDQAAKRPRGARNRSRKSVNTPSMRHPRRSRPVAVNYRPNSTTYRTA